MSIVNIICSICTEVYKNSDHGQVFSTSCGHLFHFTCLNNWLARERTCPQCRKSNPSYHELHLSFIELEEISENGGEDIHLKIKSSEEEIAQLLIQAEEIQDNFLKLQEQYSSTVTSITELKKKISRINNTEEDFLLFQAKYTEASEIKKQFEDRINQLYIENESKVNALQRIIEENLQLESDLEAECSALPNNALGEKLRSLKHKIKISTQEWEKQKEISTLLNIDKMKLQSYINGLHSTKNTEYRASKGMNRNSRQGNSNPKQLRKNSPDNFQRYVKCVIVKGLPLSEITGPLKKVILNLALKMDLVLSIDDLSGVDFVAADIQKTNSADLLVQFKEIEKQRAFLSNKKNLQDDPDTKSIFIEEFMDDESRELFLYAKKNLHNRGLIYFYFEDNKIFAKKNRMHPDGVYIYSKAQVDDIAHRHEHKKKLPENK